MPGLEINLSRVGQSNRLLAATRPKPDETSSPFKIDLGMRFESALRDFRHQPTQGDSPAAGAGLVGQLAGDAHQARGASVQTGVADLDWNNLTTEQRLCLIMRDTIEDRSKVPALIASLGPERARATYREICGADLDQDIKLFLGGQLRESCLGALGLKAGHSGTGPV